MVLSKRKGYRVERNIRLVLEGDGWKVVRAGASLGEADLICIKNGKCILLQVKSTKKKTFYYYGCMKDMIEQFPYFLVVDFGYGKVRILHPKGKVQVGEGTDFREFLRKI